MARRHPASAALVAATGLAIGLAIVPAAARAEVRILTIEPARQESLVVCQLNVTGLPDPPSLETLTSGLPSAFVFGFSLVDPAGGEVVGTEVEVRVEPDLWEGRFAIRTPLREWWVSSLDQVEDIMTRLGPLPVCPLTLLGESAVRVRTRLTVHALAPAEGERLSRILSGDSAEPDRREVSVGIGSLVRYFLGRGEADDGAATAMSPLFRPRELPLVETGPPTPPASDPAETAEDTP